MRVTDLETGALCRRLGTILRGLLVLFISTVLGQVLVACCNVAFLPAMEHWYSGLLPYPILLPVQLVMIVIMSKLVWDVYRGAGFFAQPSARLARVLLWVSVVYFLSMVVRYGVTMTLHPEYRWFGHTIPIWFHMVLAAYLYFYSRFHYQLSARQDSPSAAT